MSLYKRKDDYWYIQWKDANGNRQQRSLGQDERAARRRYKELRYKDLDAVFLGKVKKDGRLFSTIAEEFLEHAEVDKSPRTMEDYERAIGLWGKIVGDSMIDEIGIRDIIRFEHYRKKYDFVKPATLRINLSAIRAIFNWARMMEKTTNYPFRNYKLKPGARREEYMSVDELKQLIAITPNPWKRYFVILAITGWRPGEFCSLTWDDVNGDRIMLKGKAGKREFPIIDKVGLKILPYRLSRLIEGCRRDAVTNYFYEVNGRHPGYSYLKEVFALYAKQINPKYSLYTLRHTFATRLILAGVNLLAVSKLLGHSSIQTTQIYEHVGVNNIEMLL